MSRRKKGGGIRPESLTQPCMSTKTIGSYRKEVLHGYGATNTEIATKDNEDDGKDKTRAVRVDVKDNAQHTRTRRERHKNKFRVPIRVLRGKKKISLRRRGITGEQSET